MMKCLMLLLMPVLIYGYDNYMIDSFSVKTVLDSGTVTYTKAFSLPGYYGMDLGIVCNDSSSVRLKNDSVNFQYGWQIAMIVVDTGGSCIDTNWGEPCIVDTFRVSDYGTVTKSRMDSYGFPSLVYGNVDTSSVTNFASQKHYIDPGPRYIIRFWFESFGTLGVSLTGHRKGKALVLIGTIGYPIYTRTKEYTK